jgi:hypothetical protein
VIFYYDLILRFGISWSCGDVKILQIRLLGLALVTKIFVFVFMFRFVVSNSLNQLQFIDTILFAMRLKRENFGREAGRLQLSRCGSTHKSICKECEESCSFKMARHISINSGVTKRNLIPSHIELRSLVIYHGSALL